MPDMFGVNDYSAKLVSTVIPIFWYQSASISPVRAVMTGINAMLKNWVTAIQIVVLATASVLECDLIIGTAFSTVVERTKFISITNIESKVGAYWIVNISMISSLHPWVKAFFKAFSGTKLAFSQKQ